MSFVEAERALIWMWCARVVWALLPLPAGGAFADALDSWSTASARVGAVLMWAAWSAGLVALLAPRPWGLTVLRIAAPIGVGIAIAAAWSTPAGNAALAIASMVVATAFGLSAPIAVAAANALAYGDERRFPLRVPTPLLLGPVPLAVPLVGVGIASGPLLIAGGHTVAGVVAVVTGVPVAAVCGRSLHSLSRRWLVLVPAGVVVVDPLTLTEPSLLRRENVAAFRASSTTTPPADALDLRLGTLAGSIEIEMRVPQSFARRRGRAAAEIVLPRRVLVAPIRTREVLRAAGSRRIPTA